MTSVREPVEQLALCTLPYISGLSESVQRILHPLGIRTVCRSDSWKWQLMGGAKDGIDHGDVVGVIYKMCCESCPKVYIGETVRTARVRVKEHKLLARKSSRVVSSCCPCLGWTYNQLACGCCVSRKELNKEKSERIDDHQAE